MIDRLHTLLCAITKEVNRTTIKIFLVGILIDYICLNATNFFQSTIIHSRINFHTARINHWNEKRIFLNLFMMKQYWYS